MRASARDHKFCLLKFLTDLGLIGAQTLNIIHIPVNGNQNNSGPLSLLLFLWVEAVGRDLVNFIGPGLCLLYHLKLEAFHSNGLAARACWAFAGSLYSSHTEASSSLLPLLSLCLMTIASRSGRVGVGVEWECSASIPSLDQRQNLTLCCSWIVW